MTHRSLPCLLCGKTAHVSASCDSELADALRKHAKLADLMAVYLTALGVVREWGAGGEELPECFGELSRVLRQTNEAAYEAAYFDVFRMGRANETGEN